MGTATGGTETDIDVVREGEIGAGTGNGRCGDTAHQIQGSGNLAAHPECDGSLDGGEVLEEQDAVLEGTPPGECVAQPAGGPGGHGDLGRVCLDALVIEIQDGIAAGMHAGYSQDRFSSVDGGIAVGNHARTAEVEGPVVDDGSYRQFLEGGGVLEADGPEVFAAIGLGNVDVVAVKGDVAVGIGGKAGQVIAPGCGCGGIASPFADHVESLFALFPFKGDVGNHVSV